MPKIPICIDLEVEDGGGRWWTMISMTRCQCRTRFTLLPNVEGVISYCSNLWDT